MRAWDRLVFGGIAGIFGAVLGLAAALLAAMIFRTAAGVMPSALFSVLYFFCVGAIRGPDAGFLVGEVLHAVGMAVRAEAANNGVFPDQTEGEGQPRAWRSLWLVVIWLLMLAVITWHA